jgi:hypothetical protein
MTSHWGWIGMGLGAILAIAGGAWLAYQTTPIPMAPQLPVLGDLDRWYAHSVATKVVNRTQAETQGWEEEEAADR